MSKYTLPFFKGLLALSLGAILIISAYNNPVDKVNSHGTTITTEGKMEKIDLKSIIIPFGIACISGGVAMSLSKKEDDTNE